MSPARSTREWQPVGVPERGLLELGAPGGGRVMERMHGIDAFSFYCETPDSPFETLKVGIYEPVAGQEPPGADELHEFVRAQILQLGTSASMRVVRVPLDLHHPLWVRDPGYRPDEHIHRVVLPAPGDKQQLCRFLGEVMGRPLDRDRPLWEAWLIGGLEHGRIAVAMKIHHALADGRTVADLIQRSHSPAAALTTGSDREAATDPGDAIPKRSQLVADAVVDLGKTLFSDLPAYVREAYRVRKTAKATPVDETLASEPVHGRAPFTVLNKKGAGPGRLFTYETFSLPEFKQLARSFDCTINTLVLGACGEALKRYLADVDSPPSASMMAAMAVAAPGEIVHTTRLQTSRANNSVTSSTVDLHQNIEDMRERLHAIQLSSAATVDRVRRASGTRLDNLLEFLPGAFTRGLNAGMRLQQRVKSAHANFIVSNVVGPREPLTILDDRLRMVELMSTGNIIDVGHLNITVWSYVDNITFAFFIRSGVMPDPEQIPRRVREVVDELCAHTTANTPTSGGARSAGLSS